MISISGYAFDGSIGSGSEKADETFFINGCGYQKYITRDSRVKRPAGRPDYQLIYVHTGRCTLTNDGIESYYGRGSLILFKPFEPQDYFYSHKDSTETYWIHFTGGGAKQLLKNLNLNDGQVHNAGVLPEYADIFKKIILELQLRKFACQPLVCAYFSELLCSFSRAGLRPFDTEINMPGGDIKAAIEEMYTKYSENLPVSHYASLCNLSVYRFIHKFRQETGMPPHEFLTKIRLFMAKELLETSLGVSDVADIVGYEDPLYFSRIFKKQTGMPPTEYKRRSKQLRQEKTTTA